MESDLPIVPHADLSLPGNLELGAFSISLNVSDLERSRNFYESLGFVVVGGGMEENYFILKNGESTIGIFNGMFEDSILTFNPGLTNRMERLETYTDVRQIQEQLERVGVELDVPVDSDAGHQGPASVMLTDPDGNTILIDQFF